MPVPVVCVGAGRDVVLARPWPPLVALAVHPQPVARAAATVERGRDRRFARRLHALGLHVVGIVRGRSR